MLPFPDAEFCAFNINLYRANDVIFGTIIPDSRARGLVALSRFVQLNVSDGPLCQGVARRIGKTAKKCVQNSSAAECKRLSSRARSGFLSEAHNLRYRLNANYRTVDCVP